ncbi:MAG TPA: hypothetical protein VFU62_08900 [Hanamia sp.]|jgi:hypothetical protein|nr:hypothetical protein [Hanamia sp.]
MKNLLSALLVFILGSVINISCTKMDINNPASQNLNSTGKVSPNVLDCGIGYHWDYYLRKCVDDCPTGYHNDSITGACVVDGGGGGGQQNITVVTNPNNPEEVVGQEHNTGMAAIMPYYNDGTLEPTEQNVLGYTKTFLVSQVYDTSTFNEGYNYEKQHFESTIIQESNILTISNELYSQGVISATADNYLSQLSNFFASFAADSISIPSQTSYNSFANNLIANENQFAANPSLTPNDKFILFSAYSVARYSVVFVINYSIELSSSISPQVALQSNVQPNKSTTSWFSWGSAGSADVSGAIGGAAGGALVGAAAGGVGAGPGAIIGGVGGGVANSVQNAASQVFHHFFGWN